MPDPTPIPTSGGQQQTAATSADIISQLIQSSSAANEKAALAMKAATVPIPGGHMQPQQVNAPGAGHNYNQYQLDTSPVAGHHQATMQGIANVSKGVANLVGQVQKQRDEKKTQQLSVNIEQLMGAVNSADQAKQVLAQDPNNAQAKDQLDRATKIQDEILADDKNRKAISKAFNINFTDPSKNNTPEHAALKQASDSYSKQFTSRLPTTMAPNQAAIAAATAAQAEAKATNEIVGKIAPAILAAESRQNVATTAANQRAQTAKDKATADYDRDVKVAGIRADAVIKGANIHVQGMIKATQMRDETLLKATQARIDALSGSNKNSPKAIREAQQGLDSITKTLNSYQQQINLLEQNRKNAAPEQKDNYDKQIQFYEAQGKVLQKKQAELANRISDAGDVPTSDSSSDSVSRPVNYIQPTDDDENPDDYDK